MSRAQADREESATAMAPLPDDKSEGRPAERSGLRSVGEIRVLIVDDDPVVCRLAKTVLQPAGFVIDCVSEHGDLKEKLQSKPYHLVLLDYIIPGLASEDLLGWVQEYQPEASIVVMTAYPSIHSAVSCLRAHTYDYLTKPFEPDHLRTVVTRCLEAKGLLRMSEEALRESLGLAIRERRKSLGLTLAQMSHRTNLSLGYLSQIELGKNSASIETLYRISLGLGIKLADLFQAVQASLA